MGFVLFMLPYYYVVIGFKYTGRSTGQPTVCLRITRMILMWITVFKKRCGLTLQFITVRSHMFERGTTSRDVVRGMLVSGGVEGA